jgi:hypothetical protein
MAFYFDKSLIDPYLTGEYICEFGLCFHRLVRQVLHQNDLAEN